MKQPVMRHLPAIHPAILSFARAATSLQWMQRNYRFRIQPVLVGATRHFQLRIGLVDDVDRDCIPAHRSAFAQHLHLEIGHAALIDVHLELTQLLALLDERENGVSLKLRAA